MARLDPMEAAQRLVLAGDVDGAVDALRILARDNGAASAAIAEIAAFRGEWLDVFAQSRDALLRPGDLYSANVYDGLCLLVVRAGREVDDWPTVGAIARSARKLVPIADDESTESWAATAENLERASLAKNAKPLTIPPLFAADARKRKFETARQGLGEAKMKKRYPTLAARSNYLYVLANSLDHAEGALAEWESSRLVPADYESAAYLAAALAESGRADEAWRLIEARLPKWWPVSVSQVAPLNLLIHPALAALMTPDRSARVLRTPRGMAAEATS